LQVVKNGDTHSFEYQGFQVDISNASSNDFNMYYSYHEFSDMVALLGMAADYMGLKLGQQVGTFCTRGFKRPTSSKAPHVFCDGWAPVVPFSRVQSRQQLPQSVTQ
jgi:hypothetical protein